MNAINENPYVGPNPFPSEKSELFFGREREAQELLALVISERMVLFYAQSGAGKSSLINTRLIPRLKDKKFEVFRVGRVAGTDNASGFHSENIYISNLIRSLVQRDIDPSFLSKLCLSNFLEGLRNDENGYFYDAELSAVKSHNQQQRVLIIDQFEELFSMYPEAWEKRKDFFLQLAQALQSDPYLWVVLVMREDYIANLDPYARFLPGRLRTRYYMQQIEYEAALEAVKEPVRAEGFSRPYAEGVAEKLVDDLRSIKVVGTNGATETRLGQYIEPLILQVICFDIWKNLPAGGSEISESDLQTIGDVNEFLQNFYARRMTEVAQSQNISERKIRKWFVEKLISPAGVRNMVLSEPEETSGNLENRVIRALSDLVRAEQRGGSTFYELTHDRLVEPIITNNKNWEEQNINLLQRGAALWQQQGRSSGVLLRGKELREAEAWANENNNDLSPLETEYLQVCFKARSDKREWVRLNRQIRKMLMIPIVVAITAITFLIIALLLGYQSYMQNRQAEALELAAHSMNALKNDDSETALILAYQALRNYPYTGEAEEALVKALTTNISEPDITFTIQGEKALDIFLSEDHSTVETISNNGAIQTWKTESGELISTVMIQGPIEFAVFSPDGTNLLTSNHIQPANLWNTKTGKKIVQYNDYVSTANFSPDGSRIAVSTFSPDGGPIAVSTIDSVWVWSTRNESLRTKLPANEYFDNRALAFSPDGSRILDFDNNGLAGLWNTNTGKNLFLFDYSIYVAISPDGNRIGTFTRNYDINIWDANTGKKIKSIPFSRVLTSIAETCSEPNSKCIYFLTFNSDGSRIIAGVNDSSVLSPMSVFVWNTDNAKQLFKLTGNSRAITRAVFSPNEKFIATSSDDHTVRVWDIQNENEVKAYRGRHAILTINNKGDAASSAENILFSKDNSHILILWDNGQVELWKIPPSKTELLFKAETNCQQRCEFTNEQRIGYELADWTMLVYAYSDSIFIIWTVFFYLILGMVTYQKVFTNEINFSSRLKTGFTWRRFLTSSLISGLIMILYLAGVYFLVIIAMANSLILISTLPILIWLGGVYPHMTRNQFGKLTRMRRMIISMISGFSGLILVGITLLLIGLIIKAIDLYTIVLTFFVSLFISAVIGPPTNLVGSLIYMFGVYPLALRWQKYKQDEEDL